MFQGLTVLAADKHKILAWSPEIRKANAALNSPKNKKMDIQLYTLHIHINFAS